MRLLPRHAALMLYALSLAVPMRAQASEQKLTPLALLVRCYGHATQQQLPFDHPLREQVLQGMDPIDACLSLIDGAALQTAGPQAGFLIRREDPEARAVLKTFYDFFRSWFNAYSLETAYPPSDFFLTHLPGRFHDTTEAALYLTRSLFSSDAKYRDAITSPESIEGLRTSGDLPNRSAPPLLWNNNASFDGRLFHAQQPGVDNGTYVVADVMLPQMGQLLGVRAIDVLNPRKFNSALNASSNRTANPMFINRTHGGGLLGTRSYIMLNFGRGEGPIDGAMGLPRRIIDNTLRSLACRQIPVIRTSDAMSHVNKNPTNRTPAFRRSVSCMQCHATIDPASAVYRNFQWTPAARGPATLNSTWQLHAHTVSQPPEVGTVDPDSLFHLRPPNGNFLFRTNRGVLVSKPLTGIADLGAAIADTEDYYDCAAARLFEYFTGLRVDLRDEQAPENMVHPQTPLQQRYLRIVQEFGARLKASQSLRGLIEDIWRSDVYQSSSLR